MNLKPQDVVVALKLCGYGENEARPTYARVAVDLGMSPSEVHGAVRRAQAAHLIHGPEFRQRPNRTALEEFLIHGLKYAFPALHGGMARGMPTSYAAEPLKSQIAPGADPPPVWPCSNGTERGMALIPLYKCVPTAAGKDPELYELLSLVDAVRDGRARERKLAEQEIARRLRKADSVQQF